MFSPALCAFSWWWILPLIMIILCVFMMRGRRCSMMCGFGSRAFDRGQSDASESALDILDRRYASGEIDKDEYEEKVRTLHEAMDSENEWP